MLRKGSRWYFVEIPFALWSLILMANAARNSDGAHSEKVTDDSENTADSPVKSGPWRKIPRKARKVSPKQVSELCV